MRRFLALYGMVFLLIFCACASIDIPSSVEVSAKHTAEAVDEAAIERLEEAVETMPKATTIPFDYLNKKNKADPFSDIIFALDPIENQAPRFGVVYCDLPEGSIVKLWLRYEDEAGETQGQIQYASVQKGAVGYLFNIAPDTPAQKMRLEASLRMDDRQYPQSAELVSLLGEHGEYMKGAQVLERELGGRYIVQEWVLDWPYELEKTDDEGRVYLSASAEKYHRSSCRYYREGMRAVLPEIAKMQGYGACSICHA